MSLRSGAVVAVAFSLVAGCDEDSTPAAVGLDPELAPTVAIDRFSDAAGTLLRRSLDPNLPGPDEPIDFDADFYVAALAPDGAPSAYYHLDAQVGSTMEAHVLVDASGQPVADQLPILPTIVGQEGYFDFWRIVEHEVPSDYVANTITNVDDLMAEGWPSQRTTTGFNRPLVPEGSTAQRRIGSGEPGRAWYEDGVVEYLPFEEHPLDLRGDFVAYSRIFVCVGPDGFCTEDDGQTHNVLETVPGMEGYSPLWMVVPYEPSAFEQVVDLESALAAPLLDSAGMVNCPVAER